MPKFIVTLSLPLRFTEDFTALIPSHRALVSQLLDDSILETYAISADYRQGWITINSKDADEAQAVLEQLPLYPYFWRIEIHELFIFDSNTFRFPRISLN